MRWLLAAAGFVAMLLVAGLAAPPDDKPLKLPEDWKPEDPLPIEKTNCVRCHLTAGRELTVPVRDFGRSVHDLAKLSCNSCHGGNVKDDATAHEGEHGFIGTKLSAHMTACSECHTGPAEVFKKSKHYWDLSKRINRDYPVCVDCHGNHDIGKPPADFALANVCADCHKNLVQEQPHTAAVVAENDNLWKTLREVQQKNIKEPNPIPEPFRKEVNACRSATGKLMHKAAWATEAEANDLNTRVRRLREGLDMWLKEKK